MVFRWRQIMVILEDGAKLVFREALQTGLRVGAYHFFSYDSSGATQADNFIATVSKITNMLPPVVDVEFYGDKHRNLPDSSARMDETGIVR